MSGRKRKDDRQKRSHTLADLETGGWGGALEAIRRLTNTRKDNTTTEHMQNALDDSVLRNSRLKTLKSFASFEAVPQ
jgi:hypothetical protein